MSSLYLSDRLVQFIRNVWRRWTLSVTDTFHGMVFTQKVTDRNNIFSILLEANKVPHVSFLSLSRSGSIVALSIYIIKDVGCLTHQDLNKKTNQQKSLLYPIQILQIGYPILFHSCLWLQIMLISLVIWQYNRKNDGSIYFDVNILLKFSFVKLNFNTWWEQFKF